MNVPWQRTTVASYIQTSNLISANKFDSI